jgi:N6-adenosine-specific RNA methylase IME4
VSGKYRTIVADPPWPYTDAGKAGESGKNMVRTAKRDGLRAAGVHTKYLPMAVPEIEALQPPAEENAHLYLWTTNAFMVEAHQVARAWGFKQKTILTWAKTHRDDRSRISMKTGYYFRGATEHCLFCVRGSLKLQAAEALPTAYLWPRLPHSVKPDAFYDLVEKASPGPYLEMFARRARLGEWDFWGNEALQTMEVAA